MIKKADFSLLSSCRKSVSSAMSLISILILFKSMFIFLRGLMQSRTQTKRNSVTKVYNKILVI